MAERASGEGLDAAGSTGRGGFDPIASSGLFVGVSTFEDERIAEVPYAVDDAVDLAHLFAMELGLVAPGRTVLLLAGVPRKPESGERLEALRQGGARVATARQCDIYRHLAELVENVRSGGGMALLSVATHGVTDAGGDFLVATDSLADRKLRTGVVVSEVFEEASRAGRGLVLLDACREQVRRARGEGAGAAMGQGFAEAIANARGLVVLSAATLGGFAYDDPNRRNGVFTGALLDGLRGGAAPGPSGWITVRTLADFVQAQVVAWIRREWPLEEARSRGIGRRIEASAEDLPLAPHPSATRERELYRERRKKALDRVRELQGEVLSGAHWDQVRVLLPAEEPNAEAEKLLDLIEGLSDSPLSQMGLRAFLVERVLQPTEVRKERFWSGLGSMFAHRPLIVGIIFLLSVIWVGPRVLDLIRNGAPTGGTSPSGLTVGTRRQNTFGMNFLYVPSGTYTIGSPKGLGFDDERPRHEVMFSRGFWLGETEVTQEQWKKLVQNEVPWKFEACGPDCPVESVSWYSAAEFANLLSKAEKLIPCYDLKGCKGTLAGDYICESPPLPAPDCLGYRLPTESEWEVAARAGSTKEPPDLDSVAWYDQNSETTVLPVGRRQANAWGFRDLLGNVWEWTGDGFGKYPAGRVIDPRGSLESRNRIIRGCSWDSSEQVCRAAHRNWYAPSVRWYDLGFRLARGQGLRFNR